MNLQSDLERAFLNWQPSIPDVVSRRKRDVTLSWCQKELEFLPAGDLLYRLERKDKIPPWVSVYRGSKTTKRIDDLAPCSPHKFRLMVIVKTEEVPTMAKKAVEYYGSEKKAYEELGNGILKDINVEEEKDNGSGDSILTKNNQLKAHVDNTGDHGHEFKRTMTEFKRPERKTWLESRWSEEICTSTESEGTSSTCFCMAVRGGYLKQVQILLDERPELIGIINSTNGFTPLATAVRKGDWNMVRFLLSMGAEVDQRSSTGQTPLHLAVLGAHIIIIDLLLEKGADFNARDINDLRVEHYAVDSGDVATLCHVLDRGNPHVIDNNGWTPLFRAICQGASTRIVEETMLRGGDVDVTDAAGLSLPAAARLLHNRHGKPRESIMRLVDAHYPHEKAVANFTRLTKKISSLHTLFKT